MCYRLTAWQVSTSRGQKFERSQVRNIQHMSSKEFGDFQVTASALVKSTYAVTVAFASMQDSGVTAMRTVVKMMTAMKRIVCLFRVSKTGSLFKF